MSTISNLCHTLGCYKDVTPDDGDFCPECREIRAKCEHQWVNTYPVSTMMDATYQRCSKCKMRRIHWWRGGYSYDD